MTRAQYEALRYSLLADQAQAIRLRLAVVAQQIAHVMTALDHAWDEAKHRKPELVTR